MKINEITDYIETVIPLELQEDYDNSGLIIAEPDQEIRAALICLDVTEEIVDEAVGKNCNMIISHHPLMFESIRRLAGTDSEQRIISGLIRERIALYTLHTNLDNSLDGLNELLCRKLGIKNITILSSIGNRLVKLVTFCPHGHADSVRMAMFEAGAGHIGNYDCCSYNVTGKGSFRAIAGANPFVGEIDQLHFEDETRIEVILPEYREKAVIAAMKKAHPYEEAAYDIYNLRNNFDKAGAGVVGFLDPGETLSVIFDKIREVTGIPVIRFSGDLQNTVTKVALCTGSGAFLTGTAMKEKCDLFITSDLKYHDFFKPCGQMALADIGHYESEQFVREWIYSFLNKKFPNFALFISEMNTNPVNYY